MHHHLLLALLALATHRALGEIKTYDLVGFEDDDDDAHVSVFESGKFVGRFSDLSTDIAETAVVDGAMNWFDKLDAVAIRRGPDGNVYVLKRDYYDDDDDCKFGVKRFTAQGERFDVDDDDFIKPWDSNWKRGGGSCKRSRLRNSRDMEFGPDGHLYVANNNYCWACAGVGGAVNRYNGLTGRFIDEFARNGGRNQDGEDGSARLNEAIALAFGPDGDLYVVNNARDTCGENSSTDVCDACNDDDDSWNVLRYDAQTGRFKEKVVPDNDRGIDEIQDIEFHDGELFLLHQGCYDAWDIRTYVQDPLLQTWSFGRIVSDATRVPGVDSPRQMLFSSDGSIHLTSSNSGDLFRIDPTTGAAVDGATPFIHFRDEDASVGSYEDTGALAELAVCDTVGESCDDANPETTSDTCTSVGVCKGCTEPQLCQGFEDQGYNLVIQLDNRRQYCARTFYLGPDCLKICDWIITPCDGCDNLKRSPSAANAAAAIVDDNTPIDYKSDIDAKAAAAATTYEIPARLSPNATTSEDDPNGAPATSALPSGDNNNAVGLQGSRWCNACPQLVDFCDYKGVFEVKRDEAGQVLLVGGDGYDIAFSVPGQQECGVRFLRPAPIVDGPQRKRAVPAPASVGQIGSAHVFPSQSALTGDPHITGPNGEHFDFHGKPGGVYNLFSSPHFVVNAQLSVDGPATRYITKLAVLVGNVTVDVDWVLNVRDVVAALAHLNGQLAPLGAVAKLLSTRRLVIALCDHRIDVFLHHPSARAVEQFGLTTTTHYYDIDVDVPGCHDEFRGVIGQMYQCPYARGTKFDWHAEREEQFRVRSLHTATPGFDASLACFAKSAFGPHPTQQLNVKR